MKSHFGAVRTIAIRGMLRQPFGEASRRFATDALLDPQSSVRGAAIAHLLANAIDVAAYYRGILAASSTSPATVRMCLLALAGMRDADDIALVKQFLCSPAISVRAASYASWLKLAPADKDEIAAMALSDEARSIMKAGINMTSRQGAFIAFDTVIGILSRRQEWALLLQYAQSEKWNWLESIATITLATGAQHKIRPALAREIRHWMNVAGSFTRPSQAQRTYFLDPATLEALQSIAPDRADFHQGLHRELNKAPGTRA